MSSVLWPTDAYLVSKTDFFKQFYNAILCTLKKFHTDSLGIDIRLFCTLLIHIKSQVW